MREGGERCVDMEYPVRDRAGYDGKPALPTTTTFSSEYYRHCLFDIIILYYSINRHDLCQ
jgi:hypothetical protein